MRETIEHLMDTTRPARASARDRATQIGWSAVAFFAAMAVTYGYRRALLTCGAEMFFGAGVTLLVFALSVSFLIARSAQAWNRNKSVPVAMAFAVVLLALNLALMCAGCVVFGEWVMPFDPTLGAFAGLAAFLFCLWLCSGKSEPDFPQETTTRGTAIGNANDAWRASKRVLSGKSGAP